MQEYIEWAEKLKEQLHQYKNQNDFSKDEIHCIREVLHAISCAYKCQMFKDEFESSEGSSGRGSGRNGRSGRSYDGSYGGSYDGSYESYRGSGRGYSGDYWEEPSYRSSGESYRSSGESYRGRGSSQANYSRGMAEQELVKAMEDALPRIINRDLKEIVQQCLSEMRR